MTDRLNYYKKINRVVTVDLKDTNKKLLNEQRFNFYFQNKKISGYHAWKQDIINSSAEFIDEPSVVDTNLITSPHYKYSGEWMRAVIQQLQK